MYLEGFILEIFWLVMIMLINLTGSCLISSIFIQPSKTKTTVATITANRNNQDMTPVPPTAVRSTCGHSKFYHAVDSPGSGIIGGITAQPNQYPWLARLSIHVESSPSSYYRCSGAIISKSYILTAAHCVDSSSVGYVPITYIKVYLGDHDTKVVDTGEMVVNVTSWTWHPLYRTTNTTNDYDLALLKLPRNLDFSSSWAIQPICLPQTCDDNTGCTNAGSFVYTTGWGLMQEGNSSSVASVLQTAYVQIVDWTACKNEYGPMLTDTMTCAGYSTGGVDACQGDSGGPLMSNENGYYKICGVTSFGIGCGRPKYYGVYAKLCSEIEWIKSSISREDSSGTAS